MIRTPTPRDLIAIHKLRGVVLAPEEALINAYSPVRSALLSSLLPFGWGFFQPMTYVLSQEQDNQELLGIAQIQQNRRRATARVVYLAPDRAWEDRAIWSRWLDDVCQKAGERGMRRLLAYLPAEGARVSAFQQAGFHIYSHEDIFRLADLPSQPTMGGGTGFRARRAEDAWGLSRLCHATTPPVVQRAEGLSQAGRDEAICMPIASHDIRGYVLEIEQEIIGYAETRRGSRGAWVRFLLHPQASDLADTLVRGVLTCLPKQGVYCGLRDYQGEMRSALQSVGFEPFGRQALLVRYIAVFAPKSVAELVAAVERGAEVVAPVARANESCPSLASCNLTV